MSDKPAPIKCSSCQEWHDYATVEIARLQSLCADLQGVMHGVGSILDSNLPLDRNVLAGQLAEGMKEAIRRNKDAVGDGQCQHDDIWQRDDGVFICEGCGVKLPVKWVEERTVTADRGRQP